jgi:hypothetical protein
MEIIVGQRRQMTWWSSFSKAVESQVARGLKAGIVRDADSSITLLFERAVRAGKKLMAGPMERGPCVEHSGTVNSRNMLKLQKILALKNTKQNVQNSFWAFRTIFELNPINKKNQKQAGCGTIYKRRIPAEPGHTGPNGNQRRLGNGKSLLEPVGGRYDSLSEFTEKELLYQGYLSGRFMTFTAY